MYAFFGLLDHSFLPCLHLSIQTHELLNGQSEILDTTPLKAEVFYRQLLMVYPDQMIFEKLGKLLLSDGF